MRKKFLIFYFFVGLSIFLFAKKPDWVLEKPIDSEYVISIEMSDKSEGNFKEFTRQVATKNIAEFFDIKDSLSIQKLAPKIEIYKEWENKKEYWLYCRLSKSEFYRNLLIEQADDYYIGFGECYKSIENYADIAKQMAISEISTQINVSISGEVINQVIEQSGIVKEDFFSKVKLKTQAQLENIEIVKILDTDQKYWIFYKLSKQLYKEQQQKLISNALSRSLSYYYEAKSLEKDNKIVLAISSYLNSLKELENVLDKQLLTEIANKELYLDKEIYGSLQNLLLKIKIEIQEKRVVLKSGKSSKVVLFTIFNNKPIENLRVNFSVEKGSSKISEYAISNSKGEVSLLFPKPKSEINTHIIKGFIEISDFYEIDSNSFIVPIVNSLKIPEIRFEVLVEGIKFYLESVEKVENKENTMKIIEPIIKVFFISKGHIFVDDIGSAELLIQIDAYSKEGSGAMGFINSSTDVTLSITEPESSNEIFKKSVSRVKGVSNSFDQASKKTFEKAARKLKEELSDF